MVMVKAMARKMHINTRNSLFIVLMVTPFHSSSIYGGLSGMLLVLFTCPVPTGHYNILVSIYKFCMGLCGDVHNDLIYVHI